LFCETDIGPQNGYAERLIGFNPPGLPLTISLCSATGTFAICSNRIKNITTSSHALITAQGRADSARRRAGDGLGEFEPMPCGRGPCQRVRRIVCLYESCPRSVATTCAAPARWRKLLAIADEVIE